MLCVAEAVSAALIPVVRFVYVREDGAPFAKCPVLMYATAHAPVAIPFELFATGGNPGGNGAQNREGRGLRVWRNHCEAGSTYRCS